MKILKGVAAPWIDYEEYALEKIEKELALHGCRSVFFLFNPEEPLIRGFSNVLYEHLEDFVDWYHELGEGSMYLFSIGPQGSQPSFDFFLGKPHAP